MPRSEPNGGKKNKIILFCCTCLEKAGAIFEIDVNKLRHISGHLRTFAADNRELQNTQRGNIYRYRAVPHRAKPHRTSNREWGNVECSYKWQPEIHHQPGDYSRTPDLRPPVIRPPLL